jgi:hypothetical protein
MNSSDRPVSADPREIERIRQAGRTALTWYRWSLALNVILFVLLVLTLVTR